MMFRMILGLIASLFLFSVVRTIMSAMKKEFDQQNSGATGRPANPAPPKSVGGELKKCPSCGTYHAVANISGKTKAGEVGYFCSADCRSKAAAA